MNRLRLTKPVVHTGRDIFGRPAYVTLDPINSDDWVWRLPDGRDIPIMPYMLEHRPRRAVLAYDRHLFNEIEHVAPLRGVGGLQGVRVSVGPSGWPPYDGCALALWRAVMPHTAFDGELQPYRTAAEIAVDPYNQARRVTYSPDGDALHITGTIDYFMLQGTAYNFCHDGMNDVLPLIRARTLGWPPSIKYPLQLAGMLGLWPHDKCINWPFDRSADLVLGEAARHRMLDLIGVLNFAAPPGHYLTGWINSQKGGHRVDVSLLQKIAKPTIVASPVLTPQAA